jgi:predicted DCC family thiol-disulfide oxidoreductase YuxK
MTAIEHPAYSYRSDPDVPEFDDSRPLFVFDGTCVLCSGGASWLMRRDRQGKVAFTPAEGQIGAGLYRHYRRNPDETYLYVSHGRAYGLSEGYFRMVADLGGAWRLFAILRLFPRFLRDWTYRLVARNRYRWFGKARSCELLTQEQRERLV